MTESQSADMKHVVRIIQKGNVHEVPIEQVFPGAFGGPCLAFLANVRGEMVPAQVTPELERVKSQDGSETLYYSLLSRQMESAFVRAQTAQPNPTA
jgi:hypothetical protein